MGVWDGGGGGDACVVVGNCLCGSVGLPLGGWVSGWMGQWVDGSVEGLFFLFCF